MISFLERHCYFQCMSDGEWRVLHCLSHSFLLFTCYMHFFLNLTQCNGVAVESDGNVNNILVLLGNNVREVTVVFEVRLGFILI